MARSSGLRVSTAGAAIDRLGCLNAEDDINQMTNPADDLEPEEKRKRFLDSPSPSKHEQQTDHQGTFASAIRRG